MAKKFSPSNGSTAAYSQQNLASQNNRHVSPVKKTSPVNGEAITKTYSQGKLADKNNRHMHPVKKATNPNVGARGASMKDAILNGNKKN